MPFINSRVDQSHDILSSASNLQKKDFELRNLVAGVWDLASAEEEPPAEAQWMKSINPGSESVVGEDERTPVKPEDYAPGGKYRSIVKIFAQYEYSNGWAMGTGWLIRPDLMVTAGHIVFNHGPKFGRAAVIKAYIGYEGKKSIGTPGVQFRTGVRCVTTAGWLTRKGAKPFDVGFVKLNKPFEGIEPIEFMETPTSGTNMLGVVGYPGDLEHDGERGALMHEMFVEESFNLAEQDLRMLEYTIDTYGGNSGSPVFLKTDSFTKSVGVHVYGGSINSASVIGEWGNPFEDYLSVMTAPLPADGGLHYLPASRSTAVSLSGDPKDSKALYTPLEHGGRYLSDQKSQSFGSFIDDVWSNYSTTESRNEWNNNWSSYDHNKSQESQDTNGRNDADKVVRFRDGDETSQDHASQDHASSKGKVTKTIETHSTTTTTKIEINDGDGNVEDSNGGIARADRGGTEQKNRGSSSSRLVVFPRSSTQALNDTSQNQLENSGSRRTVRQSGEDAARSGTDSVNKGLSRTGEQTTRNGSSSAFNQTRQDPSQTTNRGSNQSGGQAQNGNQSFGGHSQSANGSDGSSSALNQKRQDSSQTTNRGSNQFGGQTQNGNQSSGGHSQTSNGSDGSGKAQNTDTTSSRSQQNTNTTSSRSEQRTNQSSATTTTKGFSSSSINQNSQQNTSAGMKALSDHSFSSQSGSTICAACGKSEKDCSSSGAIYDDFRQPPSTASTGMSGSKSERTSARGGYWSSQTETGDHYQSQDTTSGTLDGASGLCIACGQPACPFSQSIFQDFQGRFPVSKNKENFPYFWPGSLPPNDSQSSGTESFTLFGPKGQQSIYTEQMAVWQLGTAPWLPPSTKDVKLGQLGCFNDDGTWQVIAQITDPKDIAKANQRAYNRQKLLKPFSTGVPAIRSASNTEWSARITANVTSTDLSTNAKVDAVLPVNAEVKFGLSKKNSKGAILVVENPITKTWFESGETSFKRWIDDNVDALKSNWAKELDRGLWLIRSLITTKTAYISVLNSQKSELTIGGKVTVPGYGGGGADFGRTSSSKVDGWETHTSGPDEQRIVFMSAYRYDKGKLWGINQTESALTEMSAEECMFPGHGVVGHLPQGSSTESIFPIPTGPIWPPGHFEKHRFLS
ncbi:uncharacterized protein BDZ99DRAFT_479970 [Mytilinidion resinicola]|uniref:Serine protease n=1 Tax=Mytilinidion resinicola TaxID=574789 RepID=A0A6A6YBK4_9PEZI|nr:uncharacterized protein BDZ99DRAFT_479970 [Mytilinidion resinicola]KAF2805958.1 hypothetical protein BDZ99DRAFT_479970 [Mytilinidion resinicola]